MGATTKLIASATRENNLFWSDPEYQHTEDFHDSLVDSEAFVLDLRLERHPEERVVVLVHPCKVGFGAAADDGEQAVVIRAEPLARLADVSAVRLQQLTRV